MIRRRAFTLIELLVVIAIISVLASILLPSLKHARDLAGGVVCKSNLKQHYLAFAYYCDDNNGSFMVPGPPYYDYRKYYFPYLDGGYNGSTTCPLAPEGRYTSYRISKSYALNGRMSRAGTIDKLLGSISNSSLYVIFGDGDFVSLIYDPYAARNVAYRHPGGEANFAFLDGHAGAGSKNDYDVNWTLGPYLFD